jgi:hypothetical protein
MATMLGLAKFRLKKTWAASNQAGEQVQFTITIKE